MVIFHSYVSLPEGIHKTIILKDWIVFVILFFCCHIQPFVLLNILFVLCSALAWVRTSDTIYIYMFEIQCKQNEALDYTMRSCDGPNVSWLFQFQCSWWQGYIMFPVMMVVIMPS